MRINELRKFIVVVAFSGGKSRFVLVLLKRGVQYTSSLNCKFLLLKFYSKLEEGLDTIPSSKARDAVGSQRICPSYGVYDIMLYVQYINMSLYKTSINIYTCII